MGGVNLRMLRSVKNCFRRRPLPVKDPSALLLSDCLDMEDKEGISLVLQGLRAITVEIQALVTSNIQGIGKRTVSGIAFSRLQLMMGILQKRLCLYFGKQDVYINVVGDIKLEKGKGSVFDLAVGVASVSSFVCIPIRSDTAFVGEVGLLGELCAVPYLEKRIQEAQRMGFSHVISSHSIENNNKRR